ncbi:MAG: tetratricopeptide repeat protein [Bacteroidales bacterium]|nr:tetratricopeptide repeat protein [Bacteroidales bacterium]
MRRFFIATLTALLSAAGISGQTVIRLNEESDGRYTMNATVNGVGVLTYYAPESWYASMSTTTYLFLYENGYIADADVNGVTTVKMPNGSTDKGASFVIRNLRIGNVIVKDLPAFVVTKQTVPLVVGNSAFDCFGTVTQEGDRLIIDDRFPEDFQKAAPPVEETVDPVQSLVSRLNGHLDAEEYSEAADCFASLKDMGVLTMYSEYQYAMVLNILHRGDECIALILPWIEENKGKSLTLDYWMYDALGDCYANKGDKIRAIRYYEEAVSTYCRMFNTTEKEIRKNKFQDETLGYTLYDLALQYASISIRKTYYYASLAAKSGNAAAIDYCKKAHIRF